METWFLLPAIFHFNATSQHRSLTPPIVHLLQSANLWLSILVQLAKSLHCKLHSMQLVSAFVSYQGYSHQDYRYQYFGYQGYSYQGYNYQCTHLILIQHCSLALVLGVTKATPIPVIFPQHSSPLLCDASWAAAVTNILSGRCFKPNKSHCSQWDITSPHSH